MNVILMHQIKQRISNDATITNTLYLILFLYTLPHNSFNESQPNSKIRYVIVSPFSRYSFLNVDNCLITHKIYPKRISGCCKYNLIFKFRV